MKTETFDIVIIGAGPSGSVAASLLRKQGLHVLILEREQFPRFSIGESLLPQCMAYIEEAGMLQAVVEAGFQFKNGAAFSRNNRSTEFDFRDKFSKGWGTTYQVQRDRFDHLLANEAIRFGAEIRYKHDVIAVDVDQSSPTVTVQSPEGDTYQVQCAFILDASGFGRTLSRLLDLESPSNFPVRGAIFTHIQDNIPLGNNFDRQKILISVHPEHDDVWYWTIPFSDGRCSQGVVAETAFLSTFQGTETERLQALVAQEPGLAKLLVNAQWDTPARQIVGYSSNVKTLHGPGFALLGNAGEFLDPVFSSGVTIALKSASLAAACLAKKFKGEPVDWETDYARPLKAGVDTFRVFVESWYAGKFQKVIFHESAAPEIRRMISAILAGYAWDTTNPYVAESKRRLTVLESLCSS